MALVDYCRAELAMSARGQPMNRYHRLACAELVKLADDNAVKPEEVWKRVAALYLYRHQRPNAFADDRGFDFEMVRLTRQLSAMHFTECYSAKSGKVKRYWRTLPARVTEQIAELILTTLGVVGLHFVALERKIAEKEVQKREALSSAFAEIVTKEAAD